MIPSWRSDGIERTIAAAKDDGPSARAPENALLDRREPYDRPRLWRLSKDVEQPRCKLQAAGVDGRLDRSPDRFIRIGYRPKPPRGTPESSFLSRETPLNA
jgi:hypothetical protein